MARLYRENKVSPLGGCLWSMLPLFIMLALYRAVVKPLTIMMGVPTRCSWRAARYTTSSMLSATS